MKQDEWAETKDVQEQERKDCSGADESLIPGFHELDSTAPHEGGHYADTCGATDLAEPMMLVVGDRVCQKRQLIQGKDWRAMDCVLGGLEWGFLLGWLMTVSIRHFVYHEPFYRPWAR